MSTEILDPTFDPAEWQPARRRRLWLVAYIDLILFSVPWTLFVFAIEHVLPDVAALPPLTKFIVFAVIEGMLLRFSAWSPGAQLLGIRFVPLREHKSRIDQLWQGLVPFVSNDLKTRESWYTLALSVWFLNEGCKSLTRWTMWNPPIPFFGSPTDEIMSTLIYLVSGGIEICIAVMLFRVSFHAVAVGVPYGLAQLCSAILSWNLWDEWVAEMIVRRRDFQGLPVREGEVERMQAVTPELVVAGVVLSVAFLIMAIPRLRTRHPTMP